jgi:hypothetical protein
MRQNVLVAAAEIDLSAVPQSMMSDQETFYDGS